VKGEKPYGGGERDGNNSQVPFSFPSGSQLVARTAICNKTFHERIGEVTAREVFKE